MKQLKYILAILLTLPITSIGQTKIDSLLSKLNNKQLLISCYNTQSSLDTYSLDARELIRIGKPVTKQVVSLLADPEKGIIAHYILTRIWKEKGFKPLNNCFDTTEKRIIIFHGLTFMQDRSGSFSVKQLDIERNKTDWISFLPRHYR